jgi:hypothetical protein
LRLNAEMAKQNEERRLTHFACLIPKLELQFGMTWIGDIIRKGPFLDIMCVDKRLVLRGYFFCFIKYHLHEDSLLSKLIKTGFTKL